MLFVAIGVGTFIFGAVMYVLVKRQRDAGAGSAGETVETGSDATPGNSADDQAVEKTKLMIHGLLQSVSDNIDGLVVQTSGYDESLKGHQTAIQESGTVAGLRELERVLLGQVGQILESNRQYQDKLDQANDLAKSQKLELERVQSDAKMDFLTRIPNRRALDERMIEETSRTERYGKTFSLVLLDVDHFKKVNDTYGHATGDRILRGLAQVLDSQRRSSDFLARYGGEEFIFILPETSVVKAKAFAEKLRIKVERSSFRIENKSIRVCISVGVAEISGKGETPEGLFSRVDRALYRAKDDGRNRVVAAETPSAASS